MAGCVCSSYEDSEGSYALGHKALSLSLTMQIHTMNALNAQGDYIPRPGRLMHLIFLHR